MDHKRVSLSVAKNAPKEVAELSQQLVQAIAEMKKAVSASIKVNPAEHQCLVPKELTRAEVLEQTRKVMGKLENDNSKVSYEDCLKALGM